MKNEKEEESKRDNNNFNQIITITRNPNPNPKDYARLVSNIAIAQICQGLGFESLHHSSLQSFSNILLQFIHDLGKSSTFHANLASRSQSTFFDLFEAFKDLGFTSNCSLFIKEISDFIKAVDETPFVNPIPRFPVIKPGLIAPSFSKMGEDSGCKHVPEWLPAFPDPHTYMNSPLPLWSSKKLDLRIDEGQQARLRRKAERSLLNLQQRLLSCADDVNNGGVYDINNTKNLLVKEAFAPAILALKGGGDSDGDSDGDGRMFDTNVRAVDKRAMSVVVPVAVKRRPVVQFKMKAGKKMVVEDLDIRIRSLVCEKRGSFVRDDDRDDKKRRAQFILRQSAMEYPHEVSQM